MLTLEKIAELTLEKTGMALSIKDIWYEANRLKVIEDFVSKGKTPWATIGAYIYWSLKKPNSPFVQVSKKPALFGHRKHFASSNSTHFYIVGSRYFNDEEQRYVPVLDEMIAANAVSVGFAQSIDLTNYYQVGENEIKQFLYANGESKTAVTALKKFLQLRAGDLVAIKRIGRYSKLEIIAYARVVEDEAGNIYRWNPSGLGHLINVEFLETDALKKLSLNKGGTCHEVSDPLEIKNIFGWYSTVASLKTDEGGLSPKRKGITKKGAKGHYRNSVKGTFVSAVHDEMQQKFFEVLSKVHDKVFMEKNFIDIVVEDSKETILYEVKPFPDPVKCVREGIGQSLLYYVRNYPNLNKKIVIVGPNEPSKSEREEICLIVDLFKIPISYLSFSDTK
jgi:hypothetical protein